MYLSLYKKHFEEKTHMDVRLLTSQYTVKVFKGPAPSGSME